MMKKKIAAALFGAALASGVAVAPAQGTTAVGSWWTNHSRCTFADGSFIDSQAQYVTDVIAAAQKQTRVWKFASYSGGLSGYTVYRVQVTEYRQGNYVDKADYIYLPPRPTSIADDVYSVGSSARLKAMWINPGIETKAVYAVEYRNSANQAKTCQGQWNVGM